jgi:Ni/Co efflux regulator RcnB
MRRVFAIAAILSLAVPSLALAQAPPGGNQHGNNKGHPPARAFVRPGPVGHGPVVHGPAFHGPVVHGPVGHGPVRVGGPIVGHGPWLFHGHSYAWHPVHFPHPWVYPPGFAYRLWAVGAILPPLFWAANSPYYYAGWADMGLPPPEPGFQYVEYGPDLLLVNVATGQVVQVFPGAFS